MSSELKLLITKLSKDTSIPTYRLVTAVRKAIKSGRATQKQFIELFKKIVN
jgi:hypothetical protein